MKDKLPTRNEATKLVENLIAGSVSPSVIASWAQRFHYTTVKQKTPLIEEIERTDPTLGEFIGDLTLADALNEKGEFLYGKEDFQDWLDEFRQNTRS